jgi:DNA processing protein
MTMAARTHALLVLSQVPGIGPHRLRSLVAHFGDASRVAGASARELLAVEGIERKTAAIIASFFRGSRAAAELFAADQLLRLERLGGRLVTLWDHDYPSHLTTIFDPPPFLFLRGTLDTADNTSIALVGTRTPSPYGILMAERFAEGLAALGIPVVSGLARGIDTVAHAASVRAGNRTLAVIGSGLDVLYPGENAPLAERIVGRGALLSEFPLGTKPDAVNFPRRNRIVSGMTLGTVVIETATDGGAMITAGLAADQGREVFAVPSAAGGRRPSGTNLLIKEGKAKLTESIDDILVELAPRLKSILPQDDARRGAPALTLFEQQLVEILGSDPVHIDTLAARTGFSVADALVHLLALEFKGIVRQRPGKVFVRR